MREGRDPPTLALTRGGGQRREWTKRLDPRPVRRRSTRFPRASPRDSCSAGRGQVREVVGEPRLADPWFADEEQERARARLGRIERGCQCGDFAIATKERL